MTSLALRSALLVATLPLVAAPALAQTGQIDLRVGKLEKEMRAVQRTVFPKGVPVQPDLAPATVPTTAAGAPASAPLTDLTVRVDALEKQLASLTGATEQNSFRVKQLEEALARVQARLTSIESGTTASAASVTGNTAASPATSTAGTATPAAALTPASATPKPAVPKPVTPALVKPAGPAITKPVVTPVAAKPDPARKAAVAAVEMPATGDAAEDEYSYGFRLYTAKFFPEAQVKLKDYVAKYPATSKRWSYAQNLLGRAYLDDNKPALASVAFYDNYQKAPRGERAADSLTWLGQALVRLKKPADACKVFVELDEVYGSKLSADQKARAAKGRLDAKCAA